jgi:hypothetical protein
VVVGDDDVEAAGARGRHLVDGGDAAVDRDQQIAPARPQAADRSFGEAVAVVEAARDEPGDVRAEAAQRANHDRSRAHAVDVVVAVDDDSPAGGDLAADEGERFIDPSECARIVTFIRM